jgi:hypothetical protein
MFDPCLFCDSRLLSLLELATSIPQYGSNGTRLHPDVARRCGERAIISANAAQEAQP